MKKLIVCCDGTWNTPTQEENNLPAPTNVVKLCNALASADADGTEQLKYYHPGVGTDGSIFSKTAGGMWGEGLDRNIESGWGWLAQFYRPGDLIYLYGFSRGAYTARCIGGLLGRYGIPNLEGLTPAQGWKQIQTAYERGYMRDEKFEAWNSKSWKWHKPESVEVSLIGVWDTVGALGIPNDLSFLNLLDNPDKWRFYDTKLGSRVKQARHAVAIDEMRASFTPTLWTDEAGEPIYSDDRIKQVWFSGVHCDVGGGYSVAGLSDIALKWMIEESRKEGLAFVDSVVAQIQPDARGVMHDSFKGVFKALRSRPRNIPDFSRKECYHKLARDRKDNPPITQAPYHRTRKLKPHEEVSMPVYANLQWNETDLYLEENATYDFSATGEWLDRTIPSGPGGMDDGKFHPGEIVHMVGSLFGKLEGAWKHLTGNKEADFVGTKRIESAPWFSLIGVIANDGLKGAANPGNDGSPSPHQVLQIGLGLKNVKVIKPGYFYAYSNDAWHFYDNNRGSVQMVVRRTS